MDTEADWLLSVRKEFPGVVAAKQWILCDSPTGTQVHEVRILEERRGGLNSLTNEFYSFSIKAKPVLRSLSDITFLLFLSTQLSCWPYKC